MKLSDKAMLAQLSISQWVGRKQDKKGTNELTTSHNTTNKWVRSNKSLVAEEKIKVIAKIAGEIRAYHHERTLPWNNNGQDILPVAIYMDYTSEIRAKVNKFDNAVDTFIQEYPAMVEDAKLHLNGLYNAEDYPSASELKRKFKVSIDLFPMPNTDDFRECSLSAEEIEKIQKDSVALHNNLINKAVKDLWERLYVAIKSMADKLSCADAIFRDSLITNIQDLTAILPKLNITGDTNLDAFCSDAKRISNILPDLLRDNESIRATKASEAQALINKMKSYMA
jgi:hypothetical protein